MLAQAGEEIAKARLLLRAENAHHPMILRLVAGRNHFFDESATLARQADRP
jgi:hypothetical protein